MPELKKAHESDTELRYTSRTIHGWLLFLFGGFGTLVVFSGGSPGLEGWIAGVFCLLLLGMGLVGLVHRIELTLDLAGRRYLYRHGFRWSMEEDEGPFDDLETVVLEEDPAEGEWEVELVIDEGSSPVEVLETRDEDEARAEARRLASLLGLSMTEETERKGG